MLVSFNWYKYSVVIGLLKKRASTAMIPESDGSGYHGKIERKEDSVEEAGKRIDERVGERVGERISEGSSEGATEGASEDFFQLANKAKNDLKMGIRRSAIRKEGKGELLLSICRLLAPYTALKVLQAYPFRVAINNAIISDAARYCSIHLSSEELLKTWQEG